MSDPSKLATASKLVEFVGSSLDDLREFPAPVRAEIGHAIFTAQIGGKHPSAKPLKGSEFKGAGVLEIVEDHDGDTYRAVYTVRFEGVVYVLDAFQKNSKSGIATPRHNIARIKHRLIVAREHFVEHYASKRRG